MSHVKSYNKHGLKNIFKEHDRDLEHYKNSVDVSRSHLNFGFGITSPNDAVIAVKKRCAEIMDGKPMQDQTNVIVEWTTTLPAELLECDENGLPIEYEYEYEDEKGNIKTRKYHKPRDMEECKKYFKTVYDFTVARYGEDNVIGGWVHMDETTPHIQVVVVPEAVSRKTGRRTVSSASFLPKKELKMYQVDLAKEMLKKFGDEAKNYVLNGRTKGNYTIEELKERQANQEALDAQKERIAEDSKELRKQIASFTGAEVSASVLTAKDEALEALKQELEEQQKALRAEKQSFEEEKKAFEAEKKRFEEQQKALRAEKQELEKYREALNNRENALNDQKQKLDDFSTWFDSFKQKAEYLYNKLKSLFERFTDEQAKKQAQDEIKAPMDELEGLQRTGKQQGKHHKEQIQEAKKKAEEAKKQQDALPPVLRTEVREDRQQQIINDLEALGLASEESKEADEDENSK